ncbi:hypothetical protein T492DRAFT_475375 [Pavlovales sp. CCMP2436]|nr:hypothetical protein T492DRAFT_475375 [Pavlovales sp. CCMP2436]
MEILLPRDFCDKQSKRWKKDASRRGASKAINKLEKGHAARVASKLKELTNGPTLVGDREERVRKTAERTAVLAAANAADAVERALITSTSMPIVDRCERVEDSYWACELREGSALVVRLPKDAALRLTGVVLVNTSAAKEGATQGSEQGCSLFALRVRTPTRREPATVCILGGGDAPFPPQVPLNLDYTGDGDQLFALALEPLRPAVGAAEGEEDGDKPTTRARGRAHVTGVLRRGARAPPPQAAQKRARAASEDGEAFCGDCESDEEEEELTGAQVSEGAAAAKRAAGNAAAAQKQQSAKGADGDEADAAVGGKKSPKRGSGGAKQFAIEPSAPTSDKLDGPTVVEIGEGLKVVDNMVGKAHNGMRVSSGDKLTVRFQGLVHGPIAGSKRGGEGEGDESEWKVNV